MHFCRSTNQHIQTTNNPQQLEGKSTPQASDIMKSRIQSWVKNGEEDVAVADQYLDKKKGIKQQLRSGPKHSIGM